MRTLPLCPRVCSVAVFLLLVFGSGVGSAATLNVVGGQLMGASGVDVGGSLYDVEFLDGTCASVFSGCDEASDFTLSDWNEAGLAAQALLDQVLLDGPSGNFDSSPWLTAGCSASHCEISTRNQHAGSWAGGGFSHLVFNTVYIENDNNNQFMADFWWSDTGPPYVPHDTSTMTTYAYARWSASPVPEPSTALLLGIGLAGLGMRRRRTHIPT